MSDSLNEMRVKPCFFPLPENQTSGNYIVSIDSCQISNQVCVMIFENLFPSICLPAFMVYMPGSRVDGFYHYPSSLHSGGGVVSFADGHVEHHRWEGSDTKQPVKTGQILTHWNHSRGNPDIAWLRDHASYSLQ